jgi:hypothetical protein
MCAYHCEPILLLATARRVLFRSFRCKAGGMHLMVMCQMRLIRRRQNVFRLLKLGGFAVVPCCVLMMFSRTLMKFALSADVEVPFSLRFLFPHRGCRRARSHCSAAHDVSPVISRVDNRSKNLVTAARSPQRPPPPRYAIGRCSPRHDLQINVSHRHNPDRQAVH